MALLEIRITHQLRGRQQGSCFISRLSFFALVAHRRQTLDGEVKLLPASLQGQTIKGRNFGENHRERVLLGIHEPRALLGSR